MEGILFEARQGNLKLTAFDSKIGMYTFMEADIQQEGSVVLPARFLVDLLRRLPDGMMSIESDENLSVSIRCGRTEFHLIRLFLQFPPPTAVLCIWVFCLKLEQEN